jgi:hypothetical protein
MRPDALFLPENMKAGKTALARAHSVLQIAEPLLEINRAVGEKAHVRPTIGQVRKMFITRDPYDTIYYPTGHSRAGQPRYRWEKRPDGVELGYLLDQQP